MQTKTGHTPPLQSGLRAPLLILSACMLPYTVQGAWANCTDTSTTGTPNIVCDANAPNPWTSTIGNGRTTVDNYAVTIGSGATLSLGNANAISLHDYATINVNGTVRNTASSGAGYYGTGENVIETNSHAVITISAGGLVEAIGTQNNAEAINVHGFNNIITNYGTVRGTSGAAIWFQDEVSNNSDPALRNQVINYGLIEQVNGGNVIGTSAGNGIIFENHTGAIVHGNLLFAQGNDDLIFFPQSTVTGNIDGGGGTNNLTLNGVAGSDDTLPGALRNFTTLTKTGEGRWIVSGSLTGFTSVSVEHGTLGLTGDNTNYTGTLFINSLGTDPSATVEARAQSLPTDATNTDNVTNNGILHFVQPDDGTYIGQITGTGQVWKTGAGTTTLTPSTAAGNTYSGGTIITEGAIAITADSGLGASSGSITFQGGTLRLNTEFNLSASRAITLQQGGGTIDVQNGASILSQGMSGPGAFTKAGPGLLLLTGANAYQGGTRVAAGELHLGNGGTSGSIVGNVQIDEPARLIFNRTDDVTFDGTISGAGEVDKRGPNTTTFTASNVYTGQTLVQEGTLQLGNGGTTGGIVGDVFVGENATLALHRADYVSYGGSISGSGNLVQRGPGRFDISTSNSAGFTGDGYVSGGVLGVVNGAVVQANNMYVGADPVTGTGSGTLVIASGASLTVMNDVIIARDPGSSGAIAIGAPAGEAPDAPGTLTARQVQFGAGDNDRLEFNHTSSDYTFDATIPDGITGGSSIEVYAGRTILVQDSSTFAGSTNIHGGILQVNNQLGGVMNVLSGGTLEGTGTVGSLTVPTTNAGTIMPGTAASMFSTLTIRGDYAGQNGTLLTNVVLEGDNSPTNLLLVNGSTSGLTSVTVDNQHGQGAYTNEGIRIVQVDGDSSGAFVLNSHYTLPDGTPAVVGGALGYTLNQGGVSDPNDGDWYLRSLQPSSGGNSGNGDGSQFQPGVPLYEVYPQVMLNLNRLPTLQQRVGNRIWSGTGSADDTETDLMRGSSPIDKTGAWARIEGLQGHYKTHGTTTSSAKYNMDAFRLHMGVDGLLHEAADGSALIGGFNVHYVRGSAKVRSVIARGKIISDGYGFGGTLTWYQQNGFYVDAQAQATWFDTDIKSYTLQTYSTKGNDGFGYSFSLEAGKKYNLSDGWSLTPQAQLSYTEVDFHSFIDAYRARVSLQESESLLGRLGLAVNREHTFLDTITDDTRRLRYYALVDLYNEFLDGTKVHVGNHDFSNHRDRLWGGLSFGSSYNWKNDKYSIYGEIGAKTTFENFGENREFYGDIGVRIKI